MSEPGKRGGKRDGAGRPSRSPAERFFDNVDTLSDSGGCHPWTSSYDHSTGYARFYDGEKQDYAHRFAWRLANGKSEIPQGKPVRHLCHNKLCMNPAHLCLEGDEAHLKMRRALKEERPWNDYYALSGKRPPGRPRKKTSPPRDQSVISPLDWPKYEG